MRTDRHDSRDRTQHITTVNNVKVNIDYDKLAEAIVRAEERAKEKAENVPQEKKSFFSAVGRIIKGEKSENGKYLSASFALFCASLFRTIAFVGFLFIAVLIIAGIESTKLFEWKGWQIAYHIGYYLFFLISIVATFLYSILMLGAANDIEKEKDKSIVIAVFSSIVSVVALVVAIMTLIKG